jgi:hypothetical protein
MSYPDLPKRLEDVAYYLGLENPLDLVNIPAYRLYKVRNFGRKTFECLIKILAESKVTPRLWPTAWPKFKSAALHPENLPKEHPDDIREITMSVSPDSTPDSTATPTASTYNSLFLVELSRIADSLAAIDEHLADLVSQSGQRQSQ